MEKHNSRSRRFTRKLKQQQKKNTIPTNPLLSSYGVVILPKGTRVYHISYTPLCTVSPRKPFLFTTLHPSEWLMVPNTYIATIELQRDIKLFFMISVIKRLRLFSALPNLLSTSINNAAIKQNTSKLREWLPYLQKEGFDGWFTSIESKTTIEFAIQSDSSILKIIDCSPNQLDWKNSRYTQNNTFIPKHWGSAYSISTLENPVRFILNSRFKPMIDDYQKQVAEEDPRGTAFSLLLENANSMYIDSPVEQVKW
jgi:hypothetical protein